MTEITETTCLNIPFRITAEGHQFVMDFDRAFTTWAEAVSRVKELEAEGWIAKYSKITGGPHCVYRRRVDEGRRF